MSRKYNAPLGASLIVLSSVFYASYGIWTKLTGDFLGGYVASGLRSGLVVLLLLPVAFMYKSFQKIDWYRNWPSLLGIGLASLVIWGPLYYAILHAGVGISLTVNYASIVIGAFVFGWLFNKERFTVDKLLATALGFAGIALVFSPGLHSTGWLPLLAASVSGFATAINMVLIKKLPYNATQSTLVLWILSITANLLMAVVLREKLPALGAHIEWLYLLIFAIASVIASWLLIRGLKFIEAGAAGILGLLEIVFGVVFGMLFFHERPGAIVLFGVIIIIAAATIPYLKDYNAKRGSL
jgi:drug/metabolite transporter (DMT)-like permease